MNDKLLSVILLSYYSAGRLPGCYDELNKILSSEKIPFELIIIDDGSEDDSYNTALGLEGKHENVFAYQLSRNYTSHYAIFAGLSLCKGGCAIPIPDDGQFPYATLVEMYRAWEKGAKVILSQRTESKDPLLSNLFSNAFYSLINAISDIRLPKGGSDSFLIDREVIDILNSKIKPINTATVTEILRLGFSPLILPYSRPASSNKSSRWSFGKKWKLAKDLLYSSSAFPIKLIITTGLLFFFLSLVLIACFITIKIFDMKTGIFIFNANVQGWTSLITAVTFFGGLILLSLGVIAEYIFRIYEEVKNRPGYIIKEKGPKEKRE